MTMPINTTLGVAQPQATAGHSTWPVGFSAWVPGYLNQIQHIGWLHLDTTSQLWFGAFTACSSWCQLQISHTLATPHQVALNLKREDPSLLELLKPKSVVEGPRRILTNDRESHRLLSAVRR